MANDKNNVPQSSQDYGETRRDLWPFWNRIPKLLEELEQRTKTLSGTVADSVSGGPFAKDPYAQKEEKAKQVAKVESRLNQHLTLVTEAIARYRHQLKLIHADGQTLQGEESKHTYCETEEKLLPCIRHAVDDRKHVVYLLKRVRLTLEIAGTKKRPPEAPQEREPIGKGPTLKSPAPKTPTNRTSPGINGGDRFPLGPKLSIRDRIPNNEVGDMLSTGPLQ